jgi:inner membrane protein
MDNVTHSLAGLLLAESAVRLRGRVDGEPSSRFGTVAAISSMIAANLPDADLLYTGSGGDRLGYMLQHRGYTHTVLIAIVGAALVWGVTLFVWRWRARERPRRDEAYWLLALLLVSSLSHLVLDWTNSYGVHPFWPLDDRWRYGDAVFIIEPWLWVACIPALVAASSRRGAQALLSLVMLIGLVLAWRVDLVSTGARVALTAGAVLTVLLALVLRPTARAASAVAGWIIVTLVMAAGSSRARASTLSAVRSADPRAEVLDIVVSPLPANAVCMSVITIERLGESYRVMTARVSAAPVIAEAARCGARGPASALDSTTRQSTSAVHWDTEWKAPIAEISALARESCPALAALRFIRAPIWHALSDSTVLIGDVRYGGGSGTGFTDVPVPRHAATCSFAVPPWTPPRADLLDATVSDVETTDSTGRVDRTEHLSPKRAD